MKTTNSLIKHVLAALAAALTMQPAVAQADISSFAFVQDDGSLKVSGYLIRLYGIYIPPTDQTCYTFIRPIPCGTRASLALDFKLGGDFVHCTERAPNADGSITASCRLEDQDLSAWMLQQGWTVALPDAPFEYAALEKIARSRGVGIWGIPVDAIRGHR
ncbi:MAG: thermonuclease family protein [Herminiimonas sp.]|nr:thermonuclease family protein [Herminiimonas sp.]